MNHTGNEPYFFTLVPRTYTDSYGNPQTEYMVMMHNMDANEPPAPWRPYMSAYEAITAIGRVYVPKEVLA